MQTARQDIDVGLAIFLLCCTGGIGLCIYLIVFYNQPADRCIFCSSQTVPYYTQEHEGAPPSYQPIQPAPEPVNQSPSAYEAEKVFEEPVLEQSAGDSTGDVVPRRKFCPMCGTPFKPSQKFCEECGGDLRKFS